jgi:CheY-like chemotaxis protein
MTKNELVFIIDDDDIIIYLTQKLLESYKFCDKMEAFLDGSNAIKRLEFMIKNDEKLPDIILFDLNMPIMDGWEFVDEYLRLPIIKNIPLFVFTSSVNPSDKEMSYKYPAIKGFIQKPLTNQKIDKILRMVS